MPLPSTRQSHMDIHMGKSPAVDDNHQIDDIAYKRNIVAKTAAYTVLPSESGTFFTTLGATAAVTFTLPAFADGLEYTFFNAVDQNMTVASGTADKMMVINDIAADSVAFSSASEKIGGVVTVVSDGTYWFVQQHCTNTLTVST